MNKAAKIVENEIVRLDFGTFQQTEFRNCKLVYAGGRPPIMVQNNFVDCEWVFVGEAQNTVDFLKALARSGGGFDDLVRRTMFGEAMA
jgi:hypothetical protein